MSAVYRAHVDESDDNTYFDLTQRTNHLLKMRHNNLPPPMTVLERLQADLAAGRIKAYRDVYPDDEPRPESPDAFEDTGDE
jgi:hypothetical protein